MKVLDSVARSSSLLFASHSRSLFVLSIAIQLFEFDTRFMTTSVHLLVSDDSVSHTPLMYSEREREGIRVGEKAHVPSDCKVFSDESCRNGRLSVIKYIYINIYIHHTSMTNQKTTLLLTADRWKFY